MMHIPIPQRLSRKQLSKIIAAAIKDWVKPQNVQGLVEMLLSAYKADPSIVQNLKLLKRILEEVIREIESQQGSSQDHGKAKQASQEQA